MKNVYLWIKSLSLEYGLFILILFSIILVPRFNPFPEWFAFRLEDILLPVIIFFIILRKSYVDNYYTRYIWFFILYVIFTIVINNISELRDYFEIVKLLKYLFYLIFFFYILKKGYPFRKILGVLFYILLLLNLLHFFNVFNFNEWIEPYYASESRLMFFGKNTLGEPDTKRMLGTMCNPNNNAILFIFFAVFFLPKRKTSISNDLIFYLSFTAILLTQSRTGMLAFIIITITNIFINSFNYKHVLKQLLIFVFAFMLLNFIEYFDFQVQKEKYEMSEDYKIRRQDTTLGSIFHGSKYLTNIIESDKSETSISGRLDTWKYLWEMVKEKPFFGHGPNKEFYYSNEIYPESQYMLVLWRYGFVGLLLYAFVILLPLLLNIRHLQFKSGAPYLLFVLAMLITGIMNTPLCEPRILLLFSFVTAYWFVINEKYNLNNEKAPISRK